MDTTEAAVQYRIRKWMNIFADCKQSGMTVQQYCDANQLSRDSYYYWFKKVRALTMKQMAPAIFPLVTLCRTLLIRIQFRLSLQCREALCPRQHLPCRSGRFP